jgi:hypothetical protein
MEVKELLKVLLVLLVYILLPIAALSVYGLSGLEKIIRRFKKDFRFDIFTVFPKNEEMNWIDGIPEAMRVIKPVGATEGLGNRANNASFLTRISMN